jgi:ABC-type nitrate/sulfonate/bicarbonate transport system ATPase subunit
VFQEETLLPWLKVKDNAGLHFRFKRDRSRENREHVERLLKMVGLQDFGDYYPAKLSGGMKRRVAVLTAVAPLPEMLLLDEPFSALDEPTRIGVHRDIYKLIREFGISTTLVTHDLAEAITLSDRVLLLSRAPARIVGEYTVPFGEERNILDLRGTSEFLDLYGKIWSDLEVQIKATQE